MTHPKLQAIKERASADLSEVTPYPGFSDEYYAGYNVVPSLLNSHSKLLSQNAALVEIVEGLMREIDVAIRGLAAKGIANAALNEARALAEERLGKL